MGYNIDLSLNRLKDKRAALTAQPKTIMELFPEVPKGRIKTFVINNNLTTSADAYFSNRSNALVSDAGGVILKGTQREFPMPDLEEEDTVYFLGAGDIGIEVWYD